MPIDPSTPVTNLIAAQAGEPQSTGNLRGSSWLQYGQVLLTDVLTESYEMDEIRSADGAQVLSVHHVIKITGIINPAVNSFRNPGLTDNVYLGNKGSSITRSNNANFTDNIVLLKNWLLQDRQNLDWAVGGRIVLLSPLHRVDSPTVRYECDSQQGPKPLYCQITQITGTGTFYVRFGIETWVDPCTNAQNAIHSHRFSMAHDVDGDTWLTTRHVTGNVKFRPDIQKFQNDRIGNEIDAVDSYVHMWAHPVPPGFKRSNIKIQALPNNMELAYSFIDTEVVLPLGTLSPATKLAAEFSISSSNGVEGKPAYTQVMVHVAAVGPKNQFRMNLLRMGMKIALQKIQKPGLVQVTSMSATYSLDNMMVDLKITALWQAGQLGPQGIHMPMDGLLGPDDVADLDTALSEYRAAGEYKQGSESNKATSPKLRDYDTVGTYLGACIASGIVTGCFSLTSRPVNYFYATDANGNVPNFEETGAVAASFTTIDDNGDVVPYSFSTVTALTIDMLPTGISAAAAGSTGWYEDWQMDTRYHTNFQRAVLPIGATQGTSPGDTTFIPPQLVTLGYPYTIKSVNWSVAWVGPDPAGIILPSPDTGDTNDVLLAEDIQPAAPGISNSTMKSFRFSGTYWYACLGLHTSSVVETAYYTYDDQGFAMGKVISQSGGQEENTVGQARFTAGYSPSFV